MDSPQCYLILYNVQKLKNICTLLASASAFNVAEIFVVGQEKNFDTMRLHASQLQLPMSRFKSLKECQQHTISRNITICGIEILEQAVSLTSRDPSPFTADTAFLLGNVRSFYLVHHIG